MLRDQPLALPPAQLAERSARRVGQQHVLGDRQIAHQRQFLERGLHAVAVRVRGAAQRDPRAEQR